MRPSKHPTPGLKSKVQDATFCFVALNEREVPRKTNRIVLATFHLAPRIQKPGTNLKTRLVIKSLVYDLAWLVEPQRRARGGASRLMAPQDEKEKDGCLARARAQIRSISLVYALYMASICISIYPGYINTRKRVREEQKGAAH